MPSFTVPYGELSEGVTYHAWVLTNWSPDYGQYPEVTPPPAWGISFKVKLGLGSGGPSPADQVGSVPGRSSTPAAGAPSPGLPGSQISVNMVDGNMSFTVGTPKLASVGGGLALGFTYNSLSAQAASTPSGLSGVYYNDTNLDDATTDPGLAGANSSDVQVAARVDPTVNFDWGQTGGVAAQSPGEALTIWKGSITFPLVNGGNHTWELGDISSDGLDVFLNNNSTPADSDWATHAPQGSPSIGSTRITPTLNGSGQPNPIPIQVDWHHSTVNPAVAELFAEDVTGVPGCTPCIYQVPVSWLTHPAGILSAGWTLNASAGQAGWVGLADHRSSVTVYGPDGTGYEFTNTGGGHYSSPVEDPTAALSVDGAGDFVLDDPAGGMIYTFNPSGALASIRSASDDLHPAALSYTFGGSPSVLRQITDPVSGRSTSLVYWGDSSPACPTPPSGYDQTESSGLLCQINFWDATATNLYYSNGQLGRVADPGGVIYEFSYDSSGRMTSQMDPLAYNVVTGTSQRSADCPATSPQGCLTVIAYDQNGRVSTITSPAPNAGGTVANGGRAERGYCYVSQNGSFSSTGALICAKPAANTSALAVAGLSPSVGYSEQVRYDARNRITSTRDSAGLVTSYVWDTHDRLVSTTGPAGVESSGAYDSQGRQVSGYGPAPSSSFNPDGTPAAGQTVSTASTAYDGGMSGLAGAWYANTNTSGTPAYHNLEPASNSWPYTSTACSPQPSVIPCNPNASPPTFTPFSGHLTGLVTVPSAGRLSLDGDGGQIQLDGHPYVNQLGGPYPGQVRQDNPADWWRLGEASGATVATDTAGASNGTYTGGVTLGQSGPLADGDSTAATFNGTSGYVNLPAGFSWLAGGFSIDAWIDPTAAAAWQRIVEFGTGAISNNVIFALGPSGRDLDLSIWNSSSSQNYTISNAVTLGVWQHVAVSFTVNSSTSGTAVLYLNGTQC